MGWRNCSGCGRSYNTAKGCLTRGCKNPAQPIEVSIGSNTVQYGAGPAVLLAETITAPRTKPVVAPQISRSIAQPFSQFSPALKQDVDVLPWVVSPVVTPLMPAPVGIPVAAERFTLTVFRAEKSEWWPPPEKRLATGMVIRQPWDHTSMTELWEQLQKDMRANAKGTPAGYASYLRAEGKPFALATARTRGGAFLGYLYEIQIPNVRTFQWGPDFTLGPPANFLQVGKIIKETKVGNKTTIDIQDKVSDDYIVLNADSIQDFTILGFGHKTGTYEVTFFHHMPLASVVKCNERLLSDYKILTKEQVQKLPDAPIENKWAKDLLNHASIGLHGTK